MANKKKRSHTLALFPRSKEVREGLGLEIRDVVALLNGKPSDSSLRRLEAGDAIRLVSVRRIFDVYNNHLNGKLNYNKEVEVV